MNYLSVENLSKTQGIKPLFNNISFGIDKGQKVALIAANGTGKTSLLRIINGLDTADKGEVVFRNDIKLGYLPQEPQLNENNSVIDEVFNSDDPLVVTVRAYEKYLEDQQNGSDESPEYFQELLTRMDTYKAWDYESKASQVLSVFNITRLTQKVSELSGGQKKRLALAKVLLSEPEFLILDEPTNHLDFDMIEWLEDYLSKPNLTLFMVTHDRYFLDRVCNEILEIDRGDIYRYKGNYSYFLEKKEERENRANAEIGKARNLMRKELDWIRRMPKARGTKSKSRVDAFYDLKEKASERTKDNELQLSVKMTRVGGKILELKKVYKSYGDLQVLKGFDYTFKTGDRIGIVGKNGVGKSTFLNIITGLEAADSGKINTGETIVYGYYSQEGLKLKQDKRIIEVVKDIADVIPLADGSKLTASQFLQHFGFMPDTQYSFVSKLSGGEKRRLHLLTVLIKNPNFLILDEPTNDLDLLTLNVLEEFLAGFKGCLIIVSHDRYFLDKLVDHLFVFEGDGVIKDFIGNYSDYREYVEEKEAKKRADSRQQQKVIAKPATQAEAKKLSYNEKRELEQLEKEIPGLEKEKKAIEAALNSGAAGFDEMQENAMKLGQIIKQIEKKTERWLELSELKEEG